MPDLSLSLYPTQSANSITNICLRSISTRTTFETTQKATPRLLSSSFGDGRQDRIFILPMLGRLLLFTFQRPYGMPFHQERVHELLHRPSDLYFLFISLCPVVPTIHIYPCLCFCVTRFFLYQTIRHSSRVRNSPRNPRVSLTQ